MKKNVYLYYFINLINYLINFIILIIHFQYIKIIIIIYL